MLNLWPLDDFKFALENEKFEGKVYLKNSEDIMRVLVRSIREDISLNIFHRYYTFTQPTNDCYTPIEEDVFTTTRNKYMLFKHAVQTRNQNYSSLPDFLIEHNSAASISMFLVAAEYGKSTYEDLMDIFKYSLESEIDTRAIPLEAFRWYIDTCRDNKTLPLKNYNFNISVPDFFSDSCEVYIPPSAKNAKIYTTANYSERKAIKDQYNSASLYLMLVMLKAEYAIKFGDEVSTVLELAFTRFHEDVVRRNPKNHEEVFSDIHKMVMDSRKTCADMVQAIDTKYTPIN